MGESYRQPCKNGYCWMCAEKGYVSGNGTALTNPVPRKTVTLADGPVSRSWDNVVRASEEVA